MKIFSYYLVLFIVSITVVLAIGEVFARAFFPEFKNQISNEQFAAGKRFHTGMFLDIPTRISSVKSDIVFSPAKQIILVFGDSISGGYGLAYEDIYWSKWQRLMNLEYEDPPRVISIVALGNNFKDNYDQIKSTISKVEAANIKILGIIYQFNFNDIAPYNRQDLRELKHIDTAYKEWWKAFIRFRLDYLNRSVLQRVLTHYAARFLRNNSQICEERGASALGSISWSYGSLPVRNEAEKIWMEFEMGMQEVRRQTRSIPFFILVSPIMPDIDHKENIHVETFAKYNYVWECATIDPRARLKEISAKNEAVLVDPSSYVREHFLKRIEEENPERFFFTSDDNHFNQLASTYVAEFSYFSIIKKIIDKK